MENRQRKTRVTAVINQKGGVGKTTNGTHLATALGSMGAKVLIWDLDPNAGSTKQFGIKPETFYGTLELLTDDNISLDDAITSDVNDEVNLPKGVHIITASKTLEELGQRLGADSKFFPAGILQPYISQLRGQYDYVFLDTAPNTTVITTLAAYISADYYLLSTTPEKFSIQGLEDAVIDINAARRSGNEHACVLGVLISDVDRRQRIAKNNVPYIEDLFRHEKEAPTACFNVVISRTTNIGLAQDDGKTLFQFNPKHKVCSQFLKLAEEVEQRIHAVESASNPQEEEVVVNG